jgi:predicted Zn-ribbon and HTH transcriptional regulator
MLMGADNWTDCPRCTVTREQAVAKAKKLYGKVPLAEYEANLTAAKHDRGKVTVETLAEYYELGVRGNKFEVNYGASCRNCGFTFEFKHDQVIEL